jgi:hypothetical protein
MKRVTSILIAFSVLFAMAVHVAGANRIGGPCTFDKHSGKATITKIVKTEESKAQAKNEGGPAYEGYEIWFTFIPDKPVPANWRENVAKPQLYQLMNSWYPGDEYIKKYDIKVGKQYPATLSIIKTGTCSPIIFELQGLDRIDYFESQRGKQK